MRALTEIPIAARSCLYATSYITIPKITILRTSTIFRSRSHVTRSIRHFVRSSSFDCYGKPLRDRYIYNLSSSMTDRTLDKTASVLPQKPANPPSEDERGSPPRKRPRTKAPPQMAASISNVAESTPQPTPLPIQSVTSQSTPTNASEVRRFPIQPLDRFQGASASIKRPREVAHFSYDDNHEYRDDESSVNYYVAPPMGADLKEGFDTFRHYEDREDPHLDSLLKALVHKESKSAGCTKIKTDFVTWRGMMTKVS